jgi:mannose-6-phosphate isomerase-like protein (cupin superfamily)
MSEHTAAFVIQPADGITLQGPVGGPVTLKATGEDTKGRCTIFEIVVAPQRGPLLHLHEHQDETIHVLQGHFRFRLKDDLCEAPTGACVFVPQQTPHCFQNIGTSPGKLLRCSTQPAWRRFFIESPNLLPTQSTQRPSSR